MALTSGPHEHKGSQPDQIVGRRREGERPPDLRRAPVAGLPEEADGLRPPEDLLDALSLDLAYGIARVPGGPKVSATNSSSNSLVA